jgi:hypothetical protein
MRIRDVKNSNPGKKYSDPGIRDKQSRIRNTDPSYLKPPRQINSSY